MQLNDSLNICFLAIASRYPDCLVDIDKTLPVAPILREEGYSPEEALTLLQDAALDLLKMPACTMIDNQRFVSAIYLFDQSGMHLTFQLYCGGCFYKYRRKHHLQERMRARNIFHPHFPL